MYPLYAYSITMYPLYDHSITMYPPLCLFNLPFNYHVPPLCHSITMYPLYAIQ